MSLRYLYQIVLCSRREARCFRREIAISEREARVIKQEAMPPGYHIILERGRVANEEVFDVHLHLTEMVQEGCPFCHHSRTWGPCECGMISCADFHEREHCCPACQRIFPIEGEPPHHTFIHHRFQASASGWVHGRGPRRIIEMNEAIRASLPLPGPSPVRAGGLPPPQKLIGDGDDADKGKLRRWLEKKKKE